MSDKIAQAENVLDRLEKILPRLAAEVQNV